MKYIHISIKESANLNLSIIDDFQSIIEKYRNEIDFIEYHLNDEEDEQNYIDYIESDEIYDDGEAFYNKDLRKEYLG